MTLQKFFGRKSELKLLDNYYNNKISNLIAIKGRRRIGKSSLVREFASDKKFYKFVGLAPTKGMTAQDQRNEFARCLRSYFPSLPTMKAEDWAELFQVLASHIQRTKVIILLDEISWMSAGDETFLPKLKNAWDELFKPKMQLLLILCSSVSLWIEENILSSTAFVGRISNVMTLKELPLEVCNQFWGETTQVSEYDKFKYLSISGGIPLYLENLDPRMPVEQNIKKLCFSPGGLLLREFDNIFSDLFDKQAQICKQIVLALSGPALEIEEICQKIKMNQSGLVSRYLLNLVEAGFLSRDYTWHLQTGEFSKLSKFRLSDNYVRFYLRYLNGEKLKIERGLYDNKTLESLPAWSIVLGLQFENLVLNNRPLIWQLLDLKVDDIVVHGAYFQSKTTIREGCQIDYMIQTRYNNLFVCEIKFSRNAIDGSVIKEMTRKINLLKKPRGFSCFAVLIHVNGVHDSVIDSNFFTRIIDFSQMLGPVQE